MSDEWPLCPECQDDTDVCWVEAWNAYYCGRCVLAFNMYMDNDGDVYTVTESVDEDEYYDASRAYGTMPDLSYVEQPAFLIARRYELLKLAEASIDIAHRARDIGLEDSAKHAATMARDDALRSKAIRQELCL